MMIVLFKNNNKMNKLKELQKWILAFEKVNNSDPPIKNIKAKIKELMKEEITVIKSKSNKIYFVS